jgi:serine/threonine protein kinase
VTHKAFDVRLQRAAALKIINPQLFGNYSARQRFIREARAAASVRHPNVARCFPSAKAAGITVSDLLHDFECQIGFQTIRAPDELLQALAVDEVHRI